jgi:predicted CXXCH cytochrome family protein
MSHKKYKILSLAVLILVAALLSLQQDDPHDFEDKCYICHVGLKDPSILTRDVDQLCVFCHPGGRVRSHPSGIYPEKTLPAQFPLFREKMACASCHFPHKKYNQGEGEIAGIEPGPFLLRAEEAGKFFCHQCHQGNYIGFEVDSHALSLKRAHSGAISYELKDTVDDNSRECLSCHDGTLSVESDSQISEINWEHSRDIGLSHPISVDYAEVYFRSPRTFHPPDALDEKIRLINGKIGCTTCHDHYSELEKKLVMDNFRSRLCLSCHNL